MAKKAKPHHKPTPPRSAAAPAPAPAPRADSAKSAYWRDRLARFVAQGNEDAARELIAREWPASDPAARARTLLWAWPEQLVAELQAPPPDAVVEVLALAPLVLEDAPYAALAASPALGALASEFQACGHARTLLATGDTAGARHALTGIGLRSPLRHARLWFRAQAAYQAGDDADALRALQALATTPLAALAARATAAFTGSDAALADRLGCGAGPQPGLEEVLARLTQRRAVEALTRLQGLASALPAPVLALLRRELPAALVALGVATEHIPDRVRRALGADRDDPDELRMRALLSENEHWAADAIAQWQALAAAIQRGAAYRGVDRRGAEVALLVRVGRIQLQSASSRHRGDDFDDDFDDDDDLDFDERMFRRGGRRRRSPQHRASDLTPALATAERALALRPGHRPAWELMRDTAEATGDAVLRSEVAERAAAAFPDDVELQIRAANLLAERRSLVKAEAHANRAATLAPHDPRVRDLEARVMLQRAGKQWGARPDLALVTLRRAVGLTDQSAEVRMRVLAAAATVEQAVGEASRAAAAAAEAATRGCTPWVWLARLVQAQMELASSAVSRRGPQPAPLPPLPRPAGVPDLASLRAILRIADASVSEHGLRSALTNLAGRVAPLGVGFTERDDLRLALRFVVGGDNALSLVERAAERFPDEPDFVLVRYEFALNLHRPASYFEHAEADLRRLPRDSEEFKEFEEFAAGAARRMGADFRDWVEEAGGDDALWEFSEAGQLLARIRRHVAPPVKRAGRPAGSGATRGGRKPRGG